MSLANRTSRVGKDRLPVAVGISSPAEGRLRMRSTVRWGRKLQVRGARGTALGNGLLLLLLLLGLRTGLADAMSGSLIYNRRRFKRTQTASHRRCDSLGKKNLGRIIFLGRIFFSARCNWNNLYQKKRVWKEERLFLAGYDFLPLIFSRLCSFSCDRSERTIQ